jgi:hypothetical protein
MLKTLNFILLMFLSNRYTGTITKFIIKKTLNQTKKNSVKILNKHINQIYDDYNNTYINERSIEIPFCINLIKDKIANLQNPNILEIGNTLIHYEKSEKIARKILDKYENYPGVINEDIVEYRPNEKFDLIFSISTLEHVGSDYGEKNQQEKFMEAINRSMDLLKNQGFFIVTLPLFYRQTVDNYVFGNKSFNEKYFLIRENFNNDWKLSSEDEVKYKKDQLGYNLNYPCANSIFIGVVEKN